MVEVGRRTVHVSATIGLAMAAAETTLDKVVSLADQAMYGAKERAAASCTWSGAGTKQNRARAVAGVGGGPRVTADPESSGWR